MPSLEALVERSHEPSRALKLIAGYFRVNAILNAIGWLAIFGAALNGVKPLGSHPVRTNNLSLVIAAVGLVLIGLVWNELE